MKLKLKNVSLFLVFFLICSFMPVSSLVVKGESETNLQDVVIRSVEDGYVDIAAPTVNAKGTGSLLKPKANGSGSTVRIAYIKFDKSEFTGDITKVNLQLTATFGSGTTQGEYNVYGLFDDSWSEGTMNWNNTPNHEVTGSKASGDAQLLGSILFEATDAERAVAKKYSLDVTDFIKNHSDNTISFMIIDELGQNINLNIRASNHSTEEDRPALIFNSSQTPQQPEEPKEPEIPEPKKVPHYNVKAVTASNHDGNAPENTMDGNLATRWADSILENDVDGSWIKFDLGVEKQIGYLGMSFYNGNTRQTFFDIELSNDDVHWTKVLTNQVSTGKSIDLEPIVLKQTEAARYVKIIGHGNNNSSVNSTKWNSITEVEIYEPRNPVEVSILYEPPTAVTVDPFKYAGFIDPQGKEHPVYEANRVPSKTFDVTKAPYNAIPSDGNDDAVAIQQVLNDASKEPGTEVYFPNGTYDLVTPLGTDSFIQLKSGVNLRGESQDGVILLADASKLTASTTRVIKGFGVKDILISNITVTTIKPEGGKYSTDTKNTNPNIFGTDFTIYLALSSNKPCENIVIENVNIEHFKKGGVRIEKSHDVIVRNSNFRNATSVAGGGQGYGVVIQGIPKDPNQEGTTNDTYYNLVENSNFTGPYIRHGVLLQSYAHNNVVRNNIFDGLLLDAIDLHGEDEYLNEIYGNKIRNIATGGAIGVGNTGGTYPTNHDASGHSNYIHHNIIENCRDGINVIMGSPKTRIENNIFRNSTVEGSKGILLKNAPETIVKNNVFVDNTASDFISIYLIEDLGDKNADNIGAGIPKNITVEGNEIRNSSFGIVVEVGKYINILNNRLDNLTTGLLIKGGENIVTENNTLISKNDENKVPAENTDDNSLEVLPQTGATVDSFLLLFVGIAAIIAGMFLILRKKII